MSGYTVGWVYEGTEYTREVDIPRGLGIQEGVGKLGVYKKKMYTG